MPHIGLDIGSRNIKLAVMEAGKIATLKKEESGFDPLERCRNLLASCPVGPITATGYGRHLVEKTFSCGTVSEISAFARGALFFDPSVRTVIDVGGQDSKAIRVDGAGRVMAFEMNDKCAAGTGKFLEIMARALEMTIDEFGDRGHRNESRVRISSLCTVFAESEVISLIGRGADRRSIAYALHEMAAERASSLVSRVGVAPTVMLAGGCARNPLFTALLAEKLARPLVVGEFPEFAGAIGAALVE
ncbi:MAG TPA: acyl-CoA dehydratase activase [bacterium]|nr:acyl-CoA dehydratase activase [bacterium]